MTGRRIRPASTAAKFSPIGLGLETRTGALLIPLDRSPALAEALAASQLPMLVRSCELLTDRGHPCLRLPLTRRLRFPLTGRRGRGLRLGLDRRRVGLPLALRQFSAVAVGAPGRRTILLRLLAIGALLRPIQSIGLPALLVPAPIP